MFALLEIKELKTMFQLIQQAPEYLALLPSTLRSASPTHHRMEHYQ
jgi:hypothetical protein